MLKVNETYFQTDVKSKFLFISTLAIILFSGVMVRIWYLQIFQGRKYKQFANENSIELIKIPSMRGRILDRNGHVIAYSRASFDVAITLRRTEDLDETLSVLSQIFSWKEADEDKIRERLFEEGKDVPVVVKRDMTRDELAEVLARQYALPGVE